MTDTKKEMHHLQIVEAFSHLYDCEYDLVKLINSIRGGILDEVRNHWYDPYGIKVITEIDALAGVLAESLEGIEITDCQFAHIVNNHLVAEGKDREYVEDKSARAGEVASGSYAGKEMATIRESSDYTLYATDFMYDINIDVDAVEGDADRIRAIANGGDVVAHHLDEAVSCIKLSGRWVGMEKPMEVFGDYATKIRATLRKIVEYADKMKDIAGTVRTIENANIGDTKNLQLPGDVQSYVLDYMRGAGMMQ